MKAFYAEIMLSNPEEEEIDSLIKELKKVDLKQKMEILGSRIRESEAKMENGDVIIFQKEYSEIAKKLSALEED